ncbi:MAG: InlB B-repeat-containing protein, partial [Candidatus Cloacimonetes bacterium]|nr:InlB B-repeat-containing protein [Candidatus Cloacimonadota bacterium]MDY0368205.1 InlB B-repeat-containing protein [Candidatus Syntrophosphaera sp.]
MIDSEVYGIYVATGGRLTVNDGRIDARYSAISGNGTQNGAVVEINGGVFKSYETAAVYFPSTASLTVTGGTFEGKTGFDVRAGEVSIVGAEIIVTGKASYGGAGTSGPSSWGMGIAVIDHSSYATDSEISVFVGEGTTVTGGSYDLYIGDLNRFDSGDYVNRFNMGKLGETYTAYHNITVTVEGLLEYNTAKAAEGSPRFVINMGSGPETSTTTKITIDSVAKRIFANGTPINIDDGSADGQSSISIAAWDNGSPGGWVEMIGTIDISSYDVFGGSKETAVDNTYVSVTGGVLDDVIGGGYSAVQESRADVIGSSTVIVDSGNVDDVMGGSVGYAQVGAAHVRVSGDTTAWYVAGGGSMNGVGSYDAPTGIDRFLNITGTTEVTIEGGEIVAVFGGCYGGYSYVGTAATQISGGIIDTVVAGGMNGITSDATLNIEGNAEIKCITTGNRGEVTKAVINVVSLTRADMLIVGATTGNTSTDGGPNAIFGDITINVAQSDVIEKMILGGSIWTNSHFNPWAPERRDSLAGADVTLNAPGCTILSYDQDESGANVARDYTVGAGKTWTIGAGATLEVVSDATLTIDAGATLEVVSDATLTIDGSVISTISFDSDGGSDVLSITADYDSTVNAPAAPTKDGYIFAGWDPALPSTMPLNGASLTARWTPVEYIISFDSDGGSDVLSITADYGSAVNAPAAPTKDGYIFAGWDPALPSTMPLNGASLTAKWIEVSEEVSVEADDDKVMICIPEGCDVVQLEMIFEDKVKVTIEEDSIGSIAGGLLEVSLSKSGEGEIFELTMTLGGEEASGFGIRVTLPYAG